MTIACEWPIDFDFFPDDRVVRHFAFRDMETGEYSEALGCLQLYFVEMGKFHKGWLELRTLLDRWIAFLLWAQELDSENLPESLRADSGIVKAFAELDRMTADPAMRDAFKAEEKKRMEDAATLEHVERRGEQRGQQRLLVRQLTRHIGDVPSDILTRLDKLTPTQLDNLGEALFDLNSYAEVEAWFAQQ